MTDTLPPLPPHDPDGYQTVEPAVTFTIERVVRARRNEIFRAWTDSETFKRWIVPPDHELVSFSFEAGSEIAWTTKGSSDDERVEYILNFQTLFPYRVIEAWCFNPAVPGMLHEHPIHLSLTLEKIRSDNQTVASDYALKLSYDHASLWRYTSQFDLHTFWLEATERLTRLVERDSILSQTAA
jgi:hypothetical protein